MWAPRIPCHFDAALVFTRPDKRLKGGFEADFGAALNNSAVGSRKTECKQS
jgi:hypothetical protein